MSKHRPLGTEEKTFLSIYIASLVHTAAGDNSMNAVAENLIKLALWRWTADAISSKTGKVRVDAIKYVPSMTPHTRRAAAHLAAPPNPKKKFKGLRHEHVVPRGLLARKLIEEKVTDADEVLKFLDWHCRAVVVTDSEDGELDQAGLRDCMPEGWAWWSDPFARYATVGLYDRILFPPGG